MKPKLNAKQRARLRARRAQGVGVADLAREFKVGLATVDRVLKDEAPADAPSRAPAALAAEPTTGEPPSQDDLRRWLGEHLDRARELLDDYVAGADDRGAPNVRLASEYEASAGVLRRRAARPDRSPEQAGDELRRAEWCERRAAVMRTGGRMPADLRTPQETLSLVDDLRHGLLEISEIVARLSVSDVVEFTGALVDVSGANVGAAAPESAAVALSAFVDQVGNVLGVLGGRQAGPGDAITLLPYRPPTYEVVSSTTFRGLSER